MGVRSTTENGCKEYLKHMPKMFKRRNDSNLNKEKRVNKKISLVTQIDLSKQMIRKRHYKIQTWPQNTNKKIEES